MSFKRNQAHTLPAFSFADAGSSHARPARIRELLREIMRNPELWESIEPYTLPPGICGSKSYDQANIIRNILEYDQEHNEGQVAGFGLSDRVLWNHVYAELGKVFQVSGGRVVGLLEDKSNEQPGEVRNPGNGGEIE